MLAKTFTGATRGVDGLLVRVEVDVSAGITKFRLVGLPDTAVREAEMRVRSALAQCGFEFPSGRVTVNLAPADVKKQGSAFDLAVALGIVAAMGACPKEPLEEMLFLGELALDGRLHSVRGVLPVVCEAVRNRIARVVVPHENGREAALVKRAAVFAVGSLGEALDLVRLGRGEPLVPTESNGHRQSVLPDLSDVKGQRQAKRALAIAAAGGHNALFVGPPGAGKSLLAMRLPSLVPPLSFEDAIEVTKIYSVAGLLDDGVLVSRPPFRAPHHTISMAAMVGGGSGPMPGEVSLAHRGVLFLDELPEFSRNALDSLRQPIEDGRARIRRVDHMASLPARFTLVAAMNPCPCGFHGTDGRSCECTPAMVQRYQRKISGPLLDRIDLRVMVRAVRSNEMLSRSETESSAEVRLRVANARRLQAKRFSRGKLRLNAFMTPKHIARHCVLDVAGEEMVRQAMGRLGLSARGIHRTLKVARTIADLAGEERITTTHLAEAIHYRSASSMVG